MADDTQLFINNWSTTISDATVAVDATTINIPSADSAALGAIAANEYYVATLSDGSNLEIVWVTANDEAGALTVIRAKEGTSALSYTQGDTIECRNTKGTYENFVQQKNLYPASNADIDTGTETVDSFADTLGDVCFWFVKVKKGANIRAQIFMANWDASGNTIEYSQGQTTIDVGDTSDLVLAADIDSDIVRLRATASSDDWEVGVQRMIV